MRLPMISQAQLQIDWIDWHAIEHIEIVNEELVYRKFSHICSLLMGTRRIVMCFRDSYLGRRPY